MPETYADCLISCVHLCPLIDQGADIWRCEIISVAIKGSIKITPDRFDLKIAPIDDPNTWGYTDHYYMFTAVESPRLQRLHGRYEMDGGHVTSYPVDLPRTLAPVTIRQSSTLLLTTPRSNASHACHDTPRTSYPTLKYVHDINPRNGPRRL